MYTFYVAKMSRVMDFLFQVSNKIYAALLPRIGKLEVVLDNTESLLAVYQLLMAMSPNTTNAQVWNCFCMHTYIHMILIIGIEQFSQSDLHVGFCIIGICCCFAKTESNFIHYKDIALVGSCMPFVRINGIYVFGNICIFCLVSMQ